MYSSREAFIYLGTPTLSIGFLAVIHVLTRRLLFPGDYPRLPLSYTYLGVLYV